jgi:hypothetical protein
VPLLQIHLHELMIRSNLGGSTFPLLLWHIITLQSKGKLAHLQQEIIILLIHLHQWATAKRAKKFERHFQQYWYFRKDKTS